MKKILYIAIPFFMGCNNESTESIDPSTTDESVVLTPVQWKNANLDTGKISFGSIENTITINGIIDVPPQNLVSISVPIGGYLNSTHLLPGIEVKKGEVIASISDAKFISLQQDYLKAKSNLTYWQAEFTRQSTLNADKSTSDKVLQETQNKLDLAKIELASLVQNLQLLSVNPASIKANQLQKEFALHSPIHGFVTKVNVNIGKYVTPTDVLFELVDPSDIHLALKVFEKDVSRLAVGQKIKAFTNGNPNEIYDGEIMLISKQVDADRTVQIHCHFETYHRNLLPGTYMVANINTRNQRGYYLPLEAVVRYEGRHYVFVYANKAFRFTPIEVVELNKETVIVTAADGQRLENETIVTRNAYALLMTLKNKADE